MTKKMPKLLCHNGQEARELRRKLGMNQIDFWKRVLVTQSGGSRYESGRFMPQQVTLLLHLAYGNEKQAAAMLDYLRSSSNE